MKAILVIDIPDDIWANKEDDLGVYIELWSKRIDDGWCAEYTIDNLKPLPQKKEITEAMIWNTKYESQASYYGGFNDCVDEILG